jgi:hypothetical protein
MGVQFHEENILRTAVERMPKGMIGLVVRAGLANTETGAKIVLVIFSILIILFSGFFFIKGLDAGKPAPPAPLPDPVASYEIVQRYG